MDEGESSPQGLCPLFGLLTLGSLVGTLTTWGGVGPRTGPAGRVRFGGELALAL